MPTAAEELLLRITGDASGGQKALKDVTDQVADVGTHGEKLGEQLKQAFENPQGAVQSLAGGIKTDLLGSLGSLTGVATGVVGVLSAIGVATFELAERAAAVGGNLNDMSEKTGVSVEALSRLQNASHVAGTDLDSIGKALFMLQKGLGEDSDKVSAGLKKIGLTTEELKEAGPDRYMALIAEHMRLTADPAAKAAAVMEIFGKAGKELIPTLNKLDEALELTGDIDPWTTQQAAAAEQFEMQMASLKEHVSAVSTAIGRDLIPAAAATVEALEWLGLRIQHIVDLGGLVSGSYHAVQGALGDTALAAETAGAKQDVINKAISDGAPKTITYGDAVKYVNEQFGNLDPSQDKAKQSADAWIKKLSETAAAGIKTAAADAELTDGLARMGIVRGDGIAAANEYTAALHKSTAEATKHKDEQKKLADELLKVEHSLVAIPDSLLKIGRSYDESKLGKMADEVGKIEQNAHILNFGYKGMADGLESVGEKTKVAIDEADKWAFVGPKMEPVVRQARSLESILSEIPTTIAAAMTGGGGLSGAAQAIGSGFGANLGTQISDNLKNRLTDPVDGVATKALSPMMGSLLKAIPIVGSLIGPALSALFKIGGPSQAELDGRKIEASFEQSFGSFQKMMDAVGATYAATGRGAQQAQADVAALMAAEKQGGAATQAMVDKINGAFAEQKQDAADLTAAIGKYGFSIEQLGPAMQKQNLDGQAKELMNDWRLLVGAGIDVVTVDQKMADSTWNYLQMAKRTGQEVPEAMRPVIQSMLDQGVFTDENGDKITEMKDLGITFSETMTQGFDKVVGKLQELLEKMGKVPAALAAASGPINVDVNLNGRWNIPDAPEFGGAMAGGGDFMVTRPTLFLAGEAGPERATFSGANQAGSSMGGVNVYVTVEGNVSTERDLADALKSHIMDDLRSTTQLNLRGQRR